MLHYFLPAFVVLCLTACTPQPPADRAADGFTLDVRLSGVKDSTWFYLSNLDADTLIDSAQMIAQQLHFTGKVAQPTLALLISENGLHNQFWLENAAMTMVGEADRFRYADISGSALNTRLLHLRNELQPLEQAYDSLLGEILSLPTTDIPAQERLQIEMDRNVRRQQQSVTAFLFGQEMPPHLRLQLLYDLRSFLSSDSLRTQLEQLPPSLQASPKAAVIQALIDGEKIPQVGKAYVDVIGFDTTGTARPLSEVDARYVLLDFWASWCGPCRVENPELKKVYRDFKDQGFEIYGFSIDDQADAWRRALAEDQLPWLNVIAEHGSQSSYLAAYRVSSIPANFLIGPDGKMIASNLRSEELRDQLEDLLSQE